MTFHFGFGTLALEFGDMPRTFPGQDGPLLGQQPNLSDRGFERIRNVRGGNAADMGQVQKVGLGAKKNRSMKDQAIGVLRSDLGKLSDPVNGSDLSGLGINLVPECVDGTAMESNIRKPPGQLEMILAPLSIQPLTEKKKVHPSALEIAKPLAYFPIAARAPSPCLLKFEEGLDGTLIHGSGLFFGQDCLNARTNIQRHDVN